MQIIESNKKKKNIQLDQKGNGTNLPRKKPKSIKYQNKLKLNYKVNFNHTI